MSAAEQWDYVLDASALLALLLEEPGEAAVRAVLDHATIHTVNVAEVIGKLMRDGVPREDAVAAVEELQVQIVKEFGFREAAECGTLLASTRKLGLSLGDCVCLTVAARRGAPAVTAERLWKKIEGRTVAGGELRIEVIR